MTDCPSTHGGSGWAIGSYRDGDVVVCGICGLRTPAAGYAVPGWVESALPHPPMAQRNAVAFDELARGGGPDLVDVAQLDPRSPAAATQWLAEANFEGARMEAAHRRGREIHDAAELSWKTVTGGSGNILAAVLYDENHRCPWWAGLPLIGRRHRCPIWMVDLEAKR